MDEAVEPPINFIPESMIEDSNLDEVKVFIFA